MSGWILFALLILVMAASHAMGDSKSGETPPLSTPETIRESLDTVLDKAAIRIEEFEQEMEEWQYLRNRMEADLDAYRIEDATHSNLLLGARLRIEELENALNGSRLLAKRLDRQIRELERLYAMVAKRVGDVADRVFIANQNLVDLKDKKMLAKDRQALEARLKKIRGLLVNQRQAGDNFLQSSYALLAQMQQLRRIVGETRERLENRLDSKIESSLLDREAPFYRQINAQVVAYELYYIRERIASLFSGVFWHQLWLNFRRSAGPAPILFISLFTLVVVFHRRLHGALKEFESQLETPHWQRRRMAIRLLRRSFVLISAVLLIWLYEWLDIPYINVSLAHVFFFGAMTLLMARWSIDFIANEFEDAVATWQVFVRGRLIHLVRALRIVGLGLLLVLWVTGIEGLLGTLAIALIEAGLLVWLILFWRGFKGALLEGHRKGEMPPRKASMLVLKLLSYMVIAGSFLMEMVGYLGFAVYWVTSWIQTIVFLFWVRLSYQIIDEWYDDQRRETAVGEKGAIPSAIAPLTWFAILGARLLWLVALPTGLLLAWSSTIFVADFYRKAFNMSFAIGSVNVNGRSLVTAFLILGGTYFLVTVGRGFLRNRILKDRHLERGLKDSIVTITNYVVLGLGLLLALGVLGVNATSLAVVFGALGIGIGFGLQNIFNNFISGLILLFERPIQVGDYVEINGVWAEVKQINVRSTVVQTFDNASVIIPNADLISQQVTNWSFKDPRMRRQVDVGVAYGSDLELVRTTLLDIAATLPKILKFPEPEVLFMDHGDSALVFRLRFWTPVQKSFLTPTDVRFEVDRRFRALGIEIAFPQRDLHIRSLPEGLPSSPPHDRKG